MINVFNLNYPKEWTAPLVLDSPHSGTRLPFGITPCISEIELNKWRDLYVEDLWKNAPEHKVPFLTANYCRTFIDLNRHRYDLDPNLQEKGSSLMMLPSDYTAKTGGGLLKHFGPNGDRMIEGRLSDRQIIELLATYYHSYHGALKDLLEQCHLRFGVAYHLNCHSMYSVSPTTHNKYDNGGVPRKDFVLSHRHGQTASEEFLEVVGNVLSDFGYSVAVNDPFVGGEIIATYGKPEEGFHSLQVEIKKTLFMDEDTFEKHAGAAEVRQNLNTLVEKVAKWSQSKITVKQSSLADKLAFLSKITKLFTR